MCFLPDPSALNKHRLAGSYSFAIPEYLNMDLCSGASSTNSAQSTAMILQACYTTEDDNNVYASITTERCYLQIMQSAHIIDVHEEVEVEVIRIIVGNLQPCQNAPYTVDAIR